MAGVVLSVISVGAFIVAGAAAATATLLRARSRALRRHRQLSELNLTGIDEIDDALDRVLAQEYGASWFAGKPGFHHRSASVDLRTLVP